MKTPNFFECDCRSIEHFLKFSIDYDPGMSDTTFIYVETYLRQYNNIFKRIYRAIRYIMGYKNKGSDFDTFIFKDQDIEELESLLKQFKKLKGKKKCKN